MTDTLDRSGEPGPEDEEILRARNRVVDHWKRFFALFVSFAITLAVMRAYTCVLVRDWNGLCCFIALVVTAPPIFLGMERSLDLRYLQRSSVVPGVRIIATDSFILFLTGLFFIVLAVSIPDLSQLSLNHQPSTSLWVQRKTDLEFAFVTIIAIFFLFDAAMLSYMGGRLRGAQANDMVHYILSGTNAAAGILCLGALFLPWGGGVFPVASTFVVVAVVAVLRTVVDYVVSGRFGFFYPTQTLAKTPGYTL